MPLIDPVLLDPPPAAEGTTYRPNTASAMRRRPAIQSAVLALFDTIMETHSRVTPELKMLLAHLVSGSAGCRYCQAHTAYYADQGTFFKDVYAETPARLEKVWEYRTSPLFCDAERAAFDIAVAAGRQPIEIPPDVRAEAWRHWDDGELVEIVAIISFFGFTNRWHDTVGTRLEDAPREYADAHLSGHGWTLGKH